MKKYLVSVSNEGQPEIIKVLNQCGDVGFVTAALFTIRCADDADQIRAKIIEAFPSLSHVLVAAVDCCSYKGPSNIAFPGNILNTDN